MKFYAIFLIIILGCSFTKKNTTDKKLNNNYLYKVCRIDSIDNYYLVYLEKQEHKYKYKVVSKKTPNKGTKVVINNKYYFDLYSITYKYWLNGKELLYGEYVTCFTFEDNTIICKEGNEINALYATKNLNGLNYISKN